METDVYGFTTTVDDNYLNRVVAETAETTNFVAIREKRTDGPANVQGPYNLILLARASYLEQLADKDPNFYFMTGQVGDIIMERNYGVNRGFTEFLPGWVIYTIGDLTDAELQSEMTSVVHSLNRIDNLVNDRVVKVDVLAL